MLDTGFKAKIQAFAASYEKHGRKCGGANLNATVDDVCANAQAVCA